ncbi:ICMT-domain-containing protein [Heliocybe sulcata]|uniref:Protein-S-isoprenylcysteine O-methyltransferase n=1 Tax=Heliocybe sulcata TaxID=5364 RepID=A0A5C3NQL3_9AGAM|nr:ICMT-domain-containing protein [Heliocybe sulcata]
MATSHLAEDIDTSQAQLRPRTAVAPRHALDTVPVNPAHQPHGTIPNTPLAVSTISFLLGSVFSLGLLAFLLGGFPHLWWCTYQLGFFIAAWSAFHWGEFAVTAGWNKDKCSVDSFLLDNGVMYHVANGTAVVEYLVTLYFKPSLKNYPMISAFGIILVLIGQALRSTAMIHASTNFSHAVAFRKLESHQLVTDGIYKWFRHPSYAGFFYWALGTQLVLLNTISFVGFTIVLWRFFYYRTRAEERALIKFFGNDYIEYRRRVGTRIPFVP